MQHVLLYGICMFNSHATQSKPKAIRHRQILDCWLELNYLPDIPTVCKVSKSSQSKSPGNTAQRFPQCEIETLGHDRSADIHYLYQTPVRTHRIHLHPTHSSTYNLGYIISLPFHGRVTGESRLLSSLSGCPADWLQSHLSPGLKLPIKGVSYRSPPPGVGDLSCTLWFLALRDGERDK